MVDILRAFCLGPPGEMFAEREFLERHLLAANDSTPYPLYHVIDPRRCLLLLVESYVPIIQRP